MDFINASMRAPWAFIRNTDHRYAVKVMVEELRFLDWRVDEQRYAAADAFSRVKALGFAELGQLRRFLARLAAALQLTDGALEPAAALLHDAPCGAGCSPGWLRRLGRAWMDDLHHYCNVARWRRGLDSAQVDFNLAARELRRRRPWLMASLGPGETLDRLRSLDGAVVLFGSRCSAAGEQVLLLANMEGCSVQLEPAALPLPGLRRPGWELALATPGLAAGKLTDTIVLGDSEGALFCRDARRAPAWT